jgi:HEAT repeat protein
MRKRVVFTLFFLVLAAVIAWQVWRGREPVYQGVRLSALLQRYGPEGDSPEADDALRAIGPRAIPILLENLRARDSIWRINLPALGLRYTPAETRHLRAEKAFSALGAEASNAVPAIVEIYEQNISRTSRHAAANVLVEIGPTAKSSIPALIKSAASTNSEVRAFSVYTLGRMALEPQLVDPVLIQSLHDVDHEVRYNAAFGLGAMAFMGGDAKAAIPALVETLRDSYHTARAAAAMALGHIHSEPALVVPALIESLRDPDVFVRAQAATALGEFGTNAKPAAAVLIELLHEQNQDATNAASKAIKQIDPEAAARAGVR